MSERAIKVEGLTFAYVCSLGYVEGCLVHQLYSYSDILYFFEAV